ncbi:MAG: hypothetical protein QXL01_04750 [Thermoplasmatales archaeon]
MRYIITAEQVRALLDYLAERPYKEVAAGINFLSSLPAYEEPPVVQEKAE